MLSSFLLRMGSDMAAVVMCGLWERERGREGCWRWKQEALPLLQNCFGRRESKRPSVTQLGLAPRAFADVNGCWDFSHGAGRGTSGGRALSQRKSENPQDRGGWIGQRLRVPRIVEVWAAAAGKPMKRERLTALSVCAAPKGLAHLQLLPPALTTPSYEHALVNPMSFSLHTAEASWREIETSDALTYSLAPMPFVPEHSS